VSRAAGVTEEQLIDLPKYRESPVFSPLERLVIEYAERMTDTPVEVPDTLFAALRRELDEGQVIELSAAIAWENYRARFDHALGVEAQGFSEGAACALPERPTPAGHSVKG
jgi:alkylhydroperoxidase family enzyme